MSRRARNRLDKRATALDLARLFGHGSELPSSDEQEPAVEADPLSESGDEQKSRVDNKAFPLSCRQDTYWRTND